MASRCIVVTHAVIMAAGGEVYGPAHAVSDYLSSRRITHTKIIHPLQPRYHPSKAVVLDSASAAEMIDLLPAWAGSIRIVNHLLHTLATITFVLRRRVVYPVYIGVDPLNAVVGLLLRRMGMVQIAVYYSADYAIRRFADFFRNALYHFLDILCTRRADFVWNVSSRIYEIHKQRGAAGGRNLLIPNSPSFNEMKRYPFSKRLKRDVLLLASAGHPFDAETIVRSIMRVRSKVSDVTLSVVGGVSRESWEEALRKYEATGFIKLLGWMERKDLIELMAKHCIGIVPVSETNPWTWFADSKRIRELLASGCSVITTPSLSTADDIRRHGTGLVVDFDEDSLAAGIQRLLSDGLFLERCCQNAVGLAEVYSLDKSLDLALTECAKKLASR